MATEAAAQQGHEPPGAATLSVAARIVAARHFGRYALLSVAAPGIAARALPGQFVMVGVPGEGFHLRRPISIHSADDEVVRLLVEPRGHGSRLLVGSEVADVLEVAGPIGSGFVHAGDAPALLVGGGIGTAPLQFLADVLGARRVPVTAVFGFRDEAQARLVAAYDIADLWVATDDGSVGRRGTAVDALASVETTPSTIVYACGPAPMLAGVAAWTRAVGLTGYASLEAHMACGSGSCQGCVVATTDGYRRVCVDGPVFSFAALEDLS